MSLPGLILEGTDDVAIVVYRIGRCLHSIRHIERRHLPGLQMHEPVGIAVGSPVGPDMPDAPQIRGIVMPLPVLLVAPEISIV